MPDLRRAALLRGPLVAALAAGSAMVGCSAVPAPTVGHGPVSVATASALGPLRPATPPPLDAKRAAAGLMVVSVDGTSITPGLRHLIVDDKVGAVLLFRSNFGDSAGLRRWTQDLATLGRQAQLSAPLLVMIDQEGGQVRQLTDGPPLRSAASLSPEGPHAVRTATMITGRALHSLGVGLDLAPVADLRTNPADAVIGDRSFGSDAGVTAPLVAAAVAGLHDGGEGAALKHFPGLGGAAGDPHRAVPTDTTDAGRWASTQARSFAAGIEAGADVVMVTALRVPSLDATGTPALFSHHVVSDLLRRQLHFDGVVVTDSLSMGGLQAVSPLPQSAVTALQAGCDLLMLGNGDPGYEERALDAVRDAIAAGQVPTAQVTDSLMRVTALRIRHGLF